MNEEVVTPRLGVYDKRHLFQALISKTERLFILNKFPVDLEDYALSLQEPAVEAAWRLLRGNTKFSEALSPTQQAQVILGPEDIRFNLVRYLPEESNRNPRIFMDTAVLSMDKDNRFHSQVAEWARRQIRLEEQMLRTIGVMNAIVHACNTVGQYKRVSPELLGFLPGKYGDALKHYTKDSPYPVIDAEKKDIDTALGTLAFASLQPMHKSEEDYSGRNSDHYYRSYTLASFSRTTGYDSHDERRLNI